MRGTRCPNRYTVPLVVPRAIARNHDCVLVVESGGGLAVAVAESSFGPSGVGASLQLDSDSRSELLLFHEGPSRILISTAQPEAVERVAREHSVEALRIGDTIEGRLTIRSPNGKLVDCEVERLRQLWEKALENTLRA